METSYTLNVPVEGRACPACGDAIMPSLEPLELPGDPEIDEISYFTALELSARLEAAIVEHYLTRHRRRYWLYDMARRMRLPGRTRILG